MSVILSTVNRVIETYELKLLWLLGYEQLVDKYQPYIRTREFALDRVENFFFLVKHQRRIYL